MLVCQRSWKQSIQIVVEVLPYMWYNSRFQSHWSQLSLLKRATRPAIIFWQLWIRLAHFDWLRSGLGCKLSRNICTDLIQYEFLVLRYDEQYLLWKIYNTLKYKGICFNANAFCLWRVANYPTGNKTIGVIVSYQAVSLCLCVCVCVFTLTFISVWLCSWTMSAALWI